MSKIKLEKSLMTKNVWASALIIALILGVNQSKASELTGKGTEKAAVKEFKQLRDYSIIWKKSTIKVEPFSKKKVQLISNKKINANVKILSTRYFIAPGDNIAVSLYGEPDFTQPEILVRPDGFASIEPFGEIAIAGYTVDQLTSVLKSKFEDYLVKPKLSIKLNTMHSSKIYITGAIQKPGLYEPNSGTTATQNDRYLTSDPTVANVISNAGGIKLNADLENIKVTNKETNRDETVNLKRLLEEGDSSQDIYLSSGDCIFIPELSSEAQISDKDFLLVASSSIAPLDFPVRVTGAVFRPGVYNIKSNSPGVNSALSYSEGFSPDANRKNVTIQRTTPNGNIAKIIVNPQKNDMVLRPNDVVFVSDKNVASAARVTRFLADIVEPFRRTADTTNTWFDVFDPTRRFKNINMR